MQYCWHQLCFTTLPNALAYVSYLFSKHLHYLVGWLVIVLNLWCFESVFNYSFIRSELKIQTCIFFSVRGVKVPLHYLQPVLYLVITTCLLYYVFCRWVSLFLFWEPSSVKQLYFTRVVISNWLNIICVKCRPTLYCISQLNRSQKLYVPI